MSHRKERYFSTASLAEFLATTGPKDTEQPVTKPNRQKTRLLKKSKRQPTDANDVKKKYIPLPVYIPAASDPEPSIQDRKEDNNKVVRMFPKPPQRTCPHCHHPLWPDRPKRSSCPAAIVYQPNAYPKPPKFTSQEAKVLLEMIEQLKEQLRVERVSRQQMERRLKEATRTSG